MWHAATRPCSMLVEASAGKPITSPAAKTLMHVVRKCESTLRLPRSSGMTPSVSSPSPRVFPLRPSDHSAQSASIVSPSHRVTRARPSASPSTFVAFFPKQMRIPTSSIPWVSTVRMSSSRKRMSALRGSMSVTSTSSSAKMLAYSLPITPAPTMTSECGIVASSRMPSASTIAGCVKSTHDAREGDEPVAMSVKSVVSVVVDPSMRCTRTVCSSTISPRPRIISTPAASRPSSMRSCSSICTSVRRAMKRCIERPFGTDASHPGIGLRRIALATSAVSRKAFEATVPVFTMAPPGRDSRSIIATRRPNLAATSAAFSPAGPAPMQRRSYCHTATPSARRARNFSAIRSSSNHGRNGGIHASKSHNRSVELQG